MSKILVVEDDLTLSAGLCFALDNSGFSRSSIFFNSSCVSCL